MRQAASETNKMVALGVSAWRMKVEDIIIHGGHNTSFFSASSTYLEVGWAGRRPFISLIFSQGDLLSLIEWLANKDILYL